MEEGGVGGACIGKWQKQPEFSSGAFAHMDMNELQTVNMLCLLQLLFDTSLDSIKEKNNKTYGNHLEIRFHSLWRDTK